MCNERNTGTWLPVVKETIDSVYNYLIPHQDGITMSARDYGRRGARVCTELVSRGIIEMKPGGRGKKCHYKWVATMAPTKVLYGSIAQKLYEETSESNKSYKKKVKEKKMRAAVPMKDERPAEDVLTLIPVAIESPKPTEDEIKAGWEKFIKMYDDRPRLANMLNNSNIHIKDYNDGNMTVFFSAANEAQKQWIKDKLIGELEAKFREVLSTDKVYLRVSEFIEEPKRQQEYWETVDLNAIPIQIMWDNMKSRGCTIENNQLVLTEVKVTKTVLS